MKIQSWEILSFEELGEEEKGPEEDRYDAGKGKKKISRASCLRRGERQS